MPQMRFLSAANAMLLRPSSSAGDAAVLGEQSGAHPAPQAALHARQVLGGPAHGWQPPRAARLPPLPVFSPPFQPRKIEYEGDAERRGKGRGD